MNVNTILGAIQQSLAEKGLEVFAAKFLETKTVDDVYLCIKESRDLIALIDPEVMGRLRNMAAKTPQWFAQSLTEEYLLQAIRKERLDIFGIIVNTPNGMNWARGQVVNLRRELGLP